jgi:TPP-dependent 2-oxoacid decarboxylase
MTAPTVAAYLLKQLQKSGVDHVFGVPGDTAVLDDPLTAFRDIDRCLHAAREYINPCTWNYPEIGWIVKGGRYRLRNTSGITAMQVP